MTQQEILDRDQFVRTIIRESRIPDVVERERLAKLLMRHSRTYARYQEIFCNNGFTDEQHKRESQIQARIEQICADLGFGSPKFSGDPRGATVKLRLPSGQTNDWGQEGFCVPTS